MRLGWAFNADNGYQCFPHDPGLVRRPDVSFVRYGRFPGGVLPKGWAKIPPDLAVEVVSPNDTAYELEEKLEDYQKVGVPLVWVIYPNSRTVRVHRRRWYDKPSCTKMTNSRAKISSPVSVARCGRFSRDASHPGSPAEPDRSERARVADHR